MYVVISVLFPRIQMYQNMDGHVSDRPSVYQNRRPYSREVDSGLLAPQAHVEES